MSLSKLTKAFGLAKLAARPMSSATSFKQCLLNTPPTQVSIITFRTIYQFLGDLYIN